VLIEIGIAIAIGQIDEDLDNDPDFDFNRMPCAAALARLQRCLPG